MAQDDDRLGSEFFHKFLVNTAGSADMNVDGSSAVQTFFFIPNQNIYLTGIYGEIVDKKFLADKFADITALTNGVEIDVITGAGSSLFNIAGLADGNPVKIKTNAEWCQAVGIGFRIMAGLLDDSLILEFPNDATQKKILLRSTDGVRVRINDDLTELSGFKMMARGYNA